MKILIVSGSFYPGNAPRSYRTTELAKELVRQGHQVKVIFPDNDYDYSGWSETFSSLIIAPTKEIKWTTIELKGNKLVYWVRRVFRRLLQLFCEYPSIEWYVKIPQILKYEKKYDLLISIAVPHPIHWGIARYLKKRRELTKVWVADCGDPFMGCKTDSFKHPFYFSWLEKFFCKYADYITIPVESAKEGYYAAFYHKIRVIPQGFNFDEVELEEYVLNEPISFCYAGGFIPGLRDPRPILETLIEMKVDFRFYVFANQKDLFSGYIETLRGKLIIQEYIPRLELIRFMSTMDFLLNIENGGTSVQIPSKLIDYSLAKRPILSLNSQNLDKQKLNEFLNRDYRRQYMIGNMKSYDIKNVVNAFISLVKL